MALSFIEMHRVVALSIAGGACALALACSNASFVLDTSSIDASDGASSDAALDVDRGDVSDATAGFDARDAHRGDDAAEVDAPSPTDATSMLDVRDELLPDVADEPVHCGGGFACAPDVPAGWTGPLALYVGTSPPPMCGPNFSGSTLDGHAGLTAPAPICACNCDVPQGVHCSAPAMTFYDSQSACSAGTPCATVSPAQSACTPINVNTQCLLGIAGAVFSAPASIPSQGSCLAVSASSVPTSSWTTNARGCVATAAPARNDCPTGNLCVPTPTAAFRAKVCIEQAGDVLCPTAGYPTREVYYGAVDDTRTCSPCSCGPVTGASCTGAISQFTSMNGCANAQTIYQLPVSCAPIQQPSDVQLSLTVSAGACKPSPTSPTGIAIPSKPMTFCCAP